MNNNSHYRDRIKFTLKMKKNYTILSPSMAPIHFKILKPILLRQGFNVEIMDAEGPEVLQLAHGIRLRQQQPELLQLGVCSACR